MEEFVPLLFPGSRTISGAPEALEDVEDVTIALLPATLTKDEARALLTLSYDDTSPAGAKLTHALRNYLRPRTTICLPSDARPIKLKYGANCASCQKRLVAPGSYMYSRMLKRVWCDGCAT